MGQQCDKRGYATRQEAIDAIDGFARDNRPTKSKKKALKSYFCIHCQTWHLHSEGKKNPVSKGKSKVLVTKENLQHNKGQKILHIRNFNI